MNGIKLTLLMLGLGIAIEATAQTEIHKCTDAEGGIVYSQLPCAPVKPAKPDDDAKAAAPEGREETAPFSTEDELAVLQTEERPSRTAEETAACKKQYRDQIDAIDAEIQREYSQDKADDYKQRLLQLTRQLRQC